MSRFPQLTIAVGGVLVATGALAYFVLAEPDPETGAKSITALIPAFFGILFVGLGAMALMMPAARKGVMHGAVVLALLGAGGSFSGLLKLPRWLNDREALVAEVGNRAGAVPVQSFMAVLMVVYIVLGVMSFVAARKAPADSAAS